MSSSSLSSFAPESSNASSMTRPPPPIPGGMEGGRTPGGGCGAATAATCRPDERLGEDASWGSSIGAFGGREFDDRGAPSQTSTAAGCPGSRTPSNSSGIPCPTTVGVERFGALFAKSRSGASTAPRGGDAARGCAAAGARASLARRRPDASTAVRPHEGHAAVGDGISALHHGQPAIVAIISGPGSRCRVLKAIAGAFSVSIPRENPDKTAACDCLRPR
jgi:hypothetical protein